MEILISDLNFVPNYIVKEHKKLVVGSTVRTKNFFQHLASNFRSLIGGEVNNYTNLIKEGRAEALKRLKKAAMACGANAVLSVRFSTSSIMLSAAEILCYGTAVIIEPKKESE